MSNDQFKEAYNEGWMTGRGSFDEFVRMAGGDKSMALRIIQISGEAGIEGLRAIRPQEFQRPGYEEGLRDGQAGKPNKFTRRPLIINPSPPLNSPVLPTWLLVSALALISIILFILYLLGIIKWK